MIHTETLLYQNPESKLFFEGKISWNNTIKEKKPGILIAHAYGGQSQFEEDKAKALAALGYVGFAIDLYGKDKRAKSPEEAEQLRGELNNNRPLLLQRILLSLATLRAHPEVDDTKIAAIGFCFGGKCVLDLVRSCVHIQGAVSFHGVYDPPPNPNYKPISSPILILHGWDDPLATPQQTVALAQELTTRNADWQLMAFGNTGHAFTNPKAQAPEKGMVYHPKSNQRAWKAMRNFFQEIFT